MGGYIICTGLICGQRRNIAFAPRIVGARDNSKTGGRIINSSSRFIANTWAIESS